MREQTAQGDARSYEAAERYESRLVTEARAIAQGATSPTPTREHIRVLLDLVHRLEPHELPESPF
jgi:plasmid stabilization system protein ParE